MELPWLGAGPAVLRDSGSDTAPTLPSLPAAPGPCEAAAAPAQRLGGPWGLRGMDVPSWVMPAAFPFGIPPAAFPAVLLALQVPRASRSIPVPVLERAQQERRGRGNRRVGSAPLEGCFKIRGGLIVSFLGSLVGDGGYPGATVTLLTGTASQDPKFLTGHTTHSSGVQPTPVVTSVAFRAVLRWWLLDFFSVSSASPIISLFSSLIISLQVKAF